jgi:myo-inositol-1(or 4)-monophosphatase
MTEFNRMALRTQGIRRAGAAALDLCYTACGRLDGFWELRLHPWDVAAGGLIVQAAGGKVTDIENGDEWLSGISVVASNGRVHTELLATLPAESDKKSAP